MARDYATTIGGYGAASIIGVNHYKSASRLALEMRGEIEPEVVDGEAVEWGLRNESAILDKYMELNLCILEHCQSVFYHPDYPYMSATPDGIWIPTLTDAKNLNYFAEKEWEDGIPYIYQIQQTYYSKILRANGIPITKIDLAVLFGGQRFKVFSMDYDDELGDIIIARVKDFYDRYIINREPLDTLMSGAPVQDLDRYYKKSNGTELALNDDHVGHALSEYIRLRDMIKGLEAEKDTHEALIKAALGESARGVWTDGNRAIKVSWSDTAKTSFDKKKFEAENKELHDKYLKETSYRTFRVSEKNLTKKIENKTKRIKGE